MKKVLGVLLSIAMFMNVWGLVGVGAANESGSFATTPTPVALWDFESVSGTSVPDASGKVHVGTLGGGVSIVSGKIGKAVKFSTSGDLMKVSVTEELNFTKDDSYTIRMWVKPESLGGWQCVFGKTLTNGKTFGCWFNGAKFHFAQQSSIYYANSTAEATNDTWYQITAVQDAEAGKAYLYVNGEPVITLNQSADAASSNSAEWIFGAKNANGQETFKGLLDEVKIYREAMSAAEIKAYYQECEINYPEHAKYTGAWPVLEEGEIPNIIIDTDIGGDSDDLGAVAVFYYFAQQGKINPLAAIACSWQYAAPMLRAIGTYYGYENVPVAARGNSLDKNFSYGKYITAHFETDIEDNQSAMRPVALYRKVLAEADDNSVTIVAVGTLSNIYDLLKSQTDEYSDLTGAELVKKKVKRMICMGGQFPYGRETNIKNAAEAARYVNANWPSPILYCGYEIANNMYTATRLEEMGGESNPVSAGYRAYFNYYSPTNTAPKRPSWDPLTMYVACAGYAKYYDLCRGDVDIVKGDDGNDGYTSFSSNEKTGARAYLKLKDGYSVGDVAKVLDQIFVDAKKNNPDEVSYEYVDNTDNAVKKTSNDFTETKWKEENAFDNTYYLSKDAGAEISYTFNGSGIAAYGTFGRAYGQIDVYIDGQKKTTSDAYKNSSDYSGCLYAVSGLTAGEHTIRLVTADTKNDKSTGYQMMLDFFKVEKSAETTQPSTAATITYSAETQKITVKSAEAATLYIATYTGNTLSALQTHVITANTDGIFDFNASQTAFLWKNDMSPLCGKFNIAPQSE